MNIQLFDSATAFLAEVEADLERNEAGNNLLLGLLALYARQELNGTQPQPFMAVVKREGAKERPLLIGLLTPLNLVVSGEGGGVDELAQAAGLVVERLCEAGAEVNGVVGHPELAGALAKAWGATAGREPYIRMNQRIYRLDRVLQPARQATGRLRLAGPGDFKLAAGWIFDFAADVGETMTSTEAEKRASDSIRSESLYVWEAEGRPVSMARKARQTRNGIVVTLVYTPPDCRNRGYASACVAALSQRLLDEGRQFCSLYTDLSNPTSNAIYMNIGYAPVQDSVMYRFR